MRRLNVKYYSGPKHNLGLEYDTDDNSRTEYNRMCILLSKCLCLKKQGSDWISGYLTSGLAEEKCRSGLSNEKCRLSENNRTFI